MYNLEYFESETMAQLYEDLEDWQEDNKDEKFFSISIQKDKDLFCCIALTSPVKSEKSSPAKRPAEIVLSAPVEVVIRGGIGPNQVEVSGGYMKVAASLFR